jgi:hypothetical protein
VPSTVREDCQQFLKVSRALQHDHLLCISEFNILSLASAIAQRSIF